MKYIIYFLLIILIVGCKQNPEDPDNAHVTGYVYKYAIPKDSIIDTIIVDTLGNVDTIWRYIDWEFYEPVESVQVCVESDINSELPCGCPDIYGYTDKNGFFDIPVYLGHKEIKKDDKIIGYEYIYYCDVRVFWVKGNISYDYGGGITLSRGKEFRLYPTALNWCR